MDEAQREATVQLAADLVARQARVDDDSILPKVELSDVPAALPELPFKEMPLARPAFHYLRPGYQRHRLPAGRHAPAAAG